MNTLSFYMHVLSGKLFVSILCEWLVYLQEVLIKLQHMYVLYIRIILTSKWYYECKKCKCKNINIYVFKYVVLHEYAYIYTLYISLNKIILLNLVFHF